MTQANFRLHIGSRLHPCAWSVCRCQTRSCGQRSNVWTLRHLSQQQRSTANCCCTRLFGDRAHTRGLRKKMIQEPDSQVNMVDYTPYNELYCDDDECLSLHFIAVLDNLDGDIVEIPCFATGRRSRSSCRDSHSSDLLLSPYDIEATAQQWIWSVREASSQMEDPVRDVVCFESPFPRFLKAQVRDVSGLWQTVLVQPHVSFVFDQVYLEIRWFSLFGVHEHLRLTSYPAKRIEDSDRVWYVGPTRGTDGCLRLPSRTLTDELYPGWEEYEAVPDWIEYYENEPCPYLRHH